MHVDLFSCPSSPLLHDSGFVKMQIKTIKFSLACQVELNKNEYVFSGTKIDN
jgi:hypothetical protein